MKKYTVVFFYLMISIISFLFSIQKAHSQSNLTGTWEGNFMNDFQTVIDFRSNDQNKFEGRIQMFAGHNIVQDDPLGDIKLANSKLTFTIPAKETLFVGSLNDLGTELSGNFVFPDGSKHAISLKRKLTETKTAQEFRTLKEKKFDVQDLETDLLFLNTSLKENHPQLYTFSSKDSLDLLVDKIRSELNEPLNLEEFFLETSKLTNAVYCSHTGVKLPPSYQNLVNDFGNFFPLKLFFSSGRAFYISGMLEENHSLLPGEEIMSINDNSVVEIIEQSFYFIPSEGCNTTTKYNELNRRFNRLFYLLDDAEEFIVKFKKDNSFKSITVSSKKWSDINLADSNLDTNEQVDFNYIDKRNTGVLKISSFAIPDMDHYFYQLDSIFSDLKTKNTQNLIIDLRDNAGGHPIFAAQLFSYLTDKDFIYFKRNDDVKEFEPLYGIMQPNKLNFKGNVYALVNGGCLSTTGHLISLLKYHTKTKFIGEEPGSNFICNDFSMQMSLPKTGILVNVPRTIFETSVSGFKICNPFPIDFRVNKNAMDIIQHKDPYVELVLEQIEQTGASH